jgi:3-deoxy-D-manno-octulosonate 8-phosphate phosphatase (KDO 8-P phosphatase)
MRFSFLPMIPPEIFKRATAIKLFASDVDGVLTNGEILYADDGREMKMFNVKDGHGLSLLIHAGFDVALITGRVSVITQRRAEELKIPYLYQGIRNKLPVLEELVSELGITLEEVSYIGDDTPDIPILEVVGLSACPQDAVEAVKGICHYTAKSHGGRGAVRELIDIILAARQSNLVDNPKWTDTFQIP